MNILQVVPRIPAPPNDGGAVYIYHMTRHLAARGHHIEMAAFYSNKHEQEPDLLKPYCNLHFIDGQFKPYSFTSVLKATVARKPISIYHRMRRDLMQKLLQQVTAKPEVIILEGIHSAWFLDQIKNEFSDTPIILRQSNVEHLLLKRNGEQTANPFLRLFYFDQARLMHQFETEAMNSVDAVTAISDFDKQCYLKDLPNLQCFVNTAGAELPELLSIRRDSNRIIAISNWRWKPNYDGLKWFLEEVWPQILKHRPETSFDIIGSGLDAKFKNRYNAPSVSFLGFVDHLEPHRQKASLLVAPLFSGSGMKLKILESMASGLPVVTTSIGAEGINMKAGKHYLHAETKNEFRDAVLAILNQDPLKKSLSDEGRNFIKQNYTWHQKAIELEHILNQVIKE